MPIERRANSALASFATRLFDLSSQGPTRALALTAALLWIAALFYGGRQPIAVGLIPYPFDGLAHLAAFGALTFLFWLALFRDHPLSLVLLISMLGALDEWHQTFLPGRASSLYDWLFDVVAAVLIVYFLERMMRKRFSSTRK